MPERGTSCSLLQLVRPTGQLLQPGQPAAVDVGERLNAAACSLMLHRRHIDGRCHETETMGLLCLYHLFYT